MTFKIGKTIVPGFVGASTSARGKWSSRLCCAMLCCAGSGCLNVLSAQQVGFTHTTDGPTFEMAVPAPLVAFGPGAAAAVRGPEAGTFMFMSGMISGGEVKGRPYSAESVSETVQVLGDGNRIVHRNETKIYRDSEGRQRREQSLPEIGTLAPQSGQSQTVIFISDPVEQTSYVLHPDKMLAMKMPAPPSPLQMTPALSNGGPGSPEGGFRRTTEMSVMSGPTGQDAGPNTVGPGNGPANVIFRREIVTAGGGPETVTINGDHLSARPMAGIAVAGVGPGMVGASMVGGPGPFMTALPKPETEDLGPKVLEGVTVQGTRSKITIPAGQMGNERPIEIVDETWYSPDLELMVSSEHSDPRMGKTTYTLRNINRAEPQLGLFQVPAGYKLEEPPVPKPQIMTMPAPAR